MSRRWAYAPPPWRMYDAIVDESDRWLHLEPEELRPDVVECERPDRVVLRPWVDLAVDEVEVRLARHRAGSALTVVARDRRPELAPDDRARVRHRIGELFGAALRRWADDGDDRPPDWFRRAVR